MENDFCLEIIDWRITSKCNCKCDYCYASGNFEEMDESQLNRVLQSVVLSGCRAVCISGGEPLLNPNALSIIKYLYSAGISIYLSTNGTKYMEYHTELEQYISKLSLPLDGYDSVSNKANGREATAAPLDAFEKVIEILDYYKSHSHKFSIKIGTVLTKYNADINHYEKMFSVLKDYPIDLWKIYEVIPEARGNANYLKLKIEQNDLEKFKIDFEKFRLRVFKKSSFSVELHNRASRDSAYFIIEPNGSVIVPIEKNENYVEELFIGNLIYDNISDVISNWKNAHNRENYINNYVSRNIVTINNDNYIENIDKDIIYYLDENPLYTNKEIADSLNLKDGVNLTENDVRNRIDRLYNIRAIKHAMPIIDVSKFGLQVFLLNLYFNPTSTMDSARIADILCHNSSIAWVAECFNMDYLNNKLVFRIAVFAQGNNELGHIINELKKIFPNILTEHKLDTVPEKYIFKPKYIDNRYNSGMDHDHILLEGNRAYLSKRQLSVLLAMKYLKKIDINELTRITSYSNKKVIRVINDLQNKTIINKFQLVLDTGVLGYKCFLVFVKFINNYNVKDFISEIKKNINISHINYLNSGEWDIDMEFQVNNNAEFSKIYNSFFTNYSNVILETSIMIIKKEHKFRFLIDATTQSLENSCIKGIRKGKNEL